MRGRERTSPCKAKSVLHNLLSPAYVVPQKQRNSKVALIKHQSFRGQPKKDPQQIFSKGPGIIPHYSARK